MINSLVVGCIATPVPWSDYVSQTVWQLCRGQSSKTCALCCRVIMSYGVNEDVRCASIVKKNCTWWVFLQVLIWRQDTRWRGYDILRSNTGRTFYQRLDVRASVVDVWWSLVQFLCFVGGCSTVPGWWDINCQLLDLLMMTHVVYPRPSVREPYSVSDFCSLFTTLAHATPKRWPLKTFGTIGWVVADAGFLRFVLLLHCILPGVCVLCIILSYSSFRLDNSQSRTSFSFSCYDTQTSSYSRHNT